MLEIVALVVSVVAFGLVIRNIIYINKNNQMTDERLDDLEQHVLPSNNYHNSFIRPTAKKKEENK